jgi:endonuclease/exonuclease/phosphatase family metal-dependent hydrolase
MSARRTSPRLIGAVAAVLVAALSVLTTSPPAAAAPPAHAGRDVTVASYNLFLGGNIGSLVDPEVDTIPEFIAAAAALWQNVVTTDFPARADAIADLLAEDQPDVVGLQEVADWSTTALPGAPVPPSYDFQALLLDALAERGTPYRVIASNTNFVSPTVPIPPLGLAVQYTDHDVVIARADLPASQLKAMRPQPHTFEAGIPVTLPVGSTRIIRGWSTVDVKVRGKTFRFANTHLEAFSTEVRNLQAAELAESLAASPHPVVLAGDLNSQPTDDDGAYGTLTGTGTDTGLGLADAWVVAEGPAGGFTSGQTDPLTNVPSKIDHRIDYVLYDPDPSSPDDPVIHATEAHVIGEELADRAVSTVTGSTRLLWPSDHAGVVATLHVGRP